MSGKRRTLMFFFPRLASGRQFTQKIPEVGVDHFKVEFQESFVSELERERSPTFCSFLTASKLKDLDGFFVSFLSQFLKLHHSLIVNCLYTSRTFDFDVST